MAFIDSCDCMGIGWEDPSIGQRPLHSGWQMDEVVDSLRRRSGLMFVTYNRFRDRNQDWGWDRIENEAVIVGFDSPIS